MSLYWTSGPQPWESHEEKIIIFKYKVKVTLLSSSEKPAWTWRWRRLFVFSLSFLSHRRRMNSTHRVLVAPIFFLCIFHLQTCQTQFAPSPDAKVYHTPQGWKQKHCVWWLFDSDRTEDVSVFRPYLWDRSFYHPTSLRWGSSGFNTHARSFLFEPAPLWVSSMSLLCRWFCH